MGVITGVAALGQDIIQSLPGLAGPHSLQNHHPMRGKVEKTMSIAQDVGSGTSYQKGGSEVAWSPPRTTSTYSAPTVCQRSAKDAKSASASDICLELQIEWGCGR